MRKEMKISKHGSRKGGSGIDRKSLENVGGFGKASKEDILSNLSKKRKKRLIRVGIFLVIVIVFLFAVGVGMYIGYLNSPEKELSIGASIESIAFSEDMNNIYIKLAGGSVDKNITRIKFVFKDSEGNEYVYSTTEGVSEFSIYEESPINFNKNCFYYQCGYLVF